jgi:hypothetical protein
MALYTSGDFGAASLEPTAGDQLPATAGEEASAVAEQALHDLPTGFLARQLGRNYAEGLAVDDFGNPIDTGPPEPLLQPDELNKTYGIKGQLSFDRPMPASVAQDLHDTKHDEIVRADVIARGPAGPITWTTNRAIGLLTGLLDPLNVASSFIPVVGEAKIAAALGESLAGRLGTRAVTGALAGAAGAVPLQGLAAAQAAAEGDDYTFGNFLSGVAMGGVLGGALHTVGGVVPELARSREIARLKEAGGEGAELPAAGTEQPAANVQTTDAVSGAQAGPEGEGPVPWAAAEPPGPAVDPMRMEAARTALLRVSKDAGLPISEEEAQAFAGALARGELTPGEALAQIHSAKDAAAEKQAEAEPEKAEPEKAEPEKAGSDTVGSEQTGSGTNEPEQQGSGANEAERKGSGPAPATLDLVTERFAETPAAAVIAEHPEVGEGALRAAVAQLLEDRPVDVQPIVDQAVADAPVQAARKRAAKAKAAPAPVPLSRFLAAKGGIIDQGGDLAAMDAHRHFEPGLGKLVRRADNPKAMTLDRAREAAAEAGYLHPDSTVADLLDAIAEDMTPRRFYRPEDDAVAAQQRADASAQDEQDRLEDARQDVRRFARENDLTLDEITEIEAAVHAMHGSEPGEAIDEAIADRQAREDRLQPALRAARGDPDFAEAETQAAAEAAANAPSPREFDAVRVDGLPDAEAWAEQARANGGLEPGDLAELDAIERDRARAEGYGRAVQQAALCIATALGGG